MKTVEINFKLKKKEKQSQKTFKNIEIDILHSFKISFDSFCSDGLLATILGN